MDDNDPFFKIYSPLLMKENPVEGMVGAIRELHRSYRLVIISSTTNSPIEKYLDKHEISQHFDKVYGADVHTNKFAKIKMAFADFKVVADNCLFITDTLGDMR